MSTRTILIIVNLVAIVGVLGFIVYRVISLRRNPEAKTPDNLTPFFDDDVLEGAHLERALGVALIALVIVVIGLLAYFIWEPFREADGQDRVQGALDRARRGAVRQQPVGGVRQHQVAALRELPRRRRRRWRRRRSS